MSVMHEMRSHLTTIRNYNCNDVSSKGLTKRKIQNKINKEFPVSEILLNNSLNLAITLFRLPSSTS